MTKNKNKTEYQTVEVLSSRELMQLGLEAMEKIKILLDHKLEFPTDERIAIEVAFGAMAKFGRWALAEEEAAHRAELARKKGKK
jgi:hypothetical protein